MRGSCNILAKRHGADEECGKPSGYSQPCSCDRREIEPGYHLPSRWCAEHYDGLMNPPKGCWNCGGDDQHTTRNVQSENDGKCSSDSLAKSPRCPKDRTWVRFPSPAPKNRKIHVDSAALTHQPSPDLRPESRGFAPILRPSLI
jgi:hypothetical protein